ncbi:transport and Golgi organization protein 2 [Caerostris extrusa]|uniref:Transport and Golgi organization protein 2 n=1 Tax=Caerostris extrusa TaxID=172846 RepID=A0AAV4M876_CAEEX|nr:transport and Golgi organization protein 2 [Caerostris extrusa]
MPEDNDPALVPPNVAIGGIAMVSSRPAFCPCVDMYGFRRGKARRYLAGHEHEWSSGDPPELNATRLGHGWHQRDRGFLAVNYLESGMEGVNYLQRLRREGDIFNSFLLVTIDVKPMMGDVTAAYTNDADEGPVILKEGVHVFGNSSPSQPWKKVNAAKRIFEEVVVSRQPDSNTKKSCWRKYFKFSGMTLCTHYPDEQLDKDTEGRPEEYVKQLSAIFIKPELGLYGSRTHTVILIDSHGHVDYVEKTMKEPIDVTSNITWITTRMQFTIQDSSRIVSHL